MSKRKPFYQVTINDILKYANGVESIKERFHNSDEAYGYLVSRMHYLVDELLDKYEEVGEEDLTIINDWCDNNIK